MGDIGRDDSPTDIDILLAECKNLASGTFPVGPEYSKHFEILDSVDWCHHL